MAGMPGLGITTRSAGTFSDASKRLLRSHDFFCFLGLIAMILTRDPGGGQLQKPNSGTYHPDLFPLFPLH